MLITKLIKTLKNIYKNSNEKTFQRKTQKRFNSSLIANQVLYDDKTIIFDCAAIRGKSDIRGSIIGTHTYIMDGKLNNCKIGNYTSIATNVSVQPEQHPVTFVSTHPLFYKEGNVYPYGKDINCFDNFIKCKNGFYVNIGNDVWIGEKVIIKGGVTIGDGAIIGMGSVVTKDIPPYAIVGGVPAKIIRYRFDDKTINELLKISWWNWSRLEIENRRDDFIDINKFITKYGNQ